MDNPEKLAAQGTQDEDKQSKNTKQHVLATTTHKQTKQKHNTTCVGHHYTQTNKTKTPIFDCPFDILLTFILYLTMNQKNNECG
jgi:hypothetical protein